MAQLVKENTVVRDVVHTREDCRLCGSTDLEQVWSFGPTPLANSYIKPEEVHNPEVFAPLDVYYCGECHLVQLRDVVAPDVLFSHYLYVSSTSPSFVAHFEDYADHLITRFALPEKSLVVDVGSNDGILLKPFQERGMRVLGIDPAENVAEMANASGIETVAEFFTPDVAAHLAATYGKAEIISANNVFAHTDGVDVFTRAVKEFLADDGIFVFEVQYLKDLIENNLFDIVYHEHVCYYHVTPLISFFKRLGMEVFDVEHPPVHGGSIRVFVQHAGGPHSKTTGLADTIAAEEKAGLNTIAPYTKFAERIEANKQTLRTMLADLKSQGKRIVGYGAPAKATTLLYAFDIGADTLDYIVDDSPLKQGRLMPGNHIPIHSPEKLYEDKVDYCVILAWNFAEPIMKNHKRFTDQGGRFIIPVPEPQII